MFVLTIKDKDGIHIPIAKSEKQAIVDEISNLAQGSKILSIEDISETGHVEDLMIEPFIIEANQSKIESMLKRIPHI